MFGAKKIPELAKGLGTGIKEFKKATREVTDEIQNAPTETPAKPAPAPPAPSRADLPVAQSTTSAQGLTAGISRHGRATEPDRPDESPEGGPVKTFLEHLEDFRWVLIKSIVALFLGMLVCLIGGATTSSESSNGR